MRAAASLCVLLLAGGLWLSGLSATPAHAEGTPYTEDPTDTPKPKPKPAVKHRKPVARPTPVMPAAPVPYSAYSSGVLTPEIAKALTPAPAAPLPPPVAVIPAPVTMPPIAEAPPPAPVARTQAKPAPDATVSDQISLRCETQVTEGKRFLSQGVFYIDLFPSPVFPDEHADFKFLFVDPAHSSLIRRSICLDTMCPADVTGAAYYLVNRVTRHGSALRITLDRSNGAFYAEEIDNRRVGKDGHLGEKGFCTPQKLPNALF